MSSWILPCLSALTKYFLSGTKSYSSKKKQFCLGQNIFCPGQKFYPWLETNFPKAKMIFKPWTKFLSWTQIFWPWHNYLILDKSDFVPDKQYFVQADGQGICQLIFASAQLLNFKNDLSIVFFFLRSHQSELVLIYYWWHIVRAPLALEWVWEVPLNPLVFWEGFSSSSIVWKS